jgi:hypothetical protein
MHSPLPERVAMLGKGDSPLELREGALAEASVVVVIVIGGGKATSSAASAIASTAAGAVVVVISSTDHCFRWGELQLGARVGAV